MRYVIGFIVVAFIAVSLYAFAKQSHDCSEKGGELMRKASGTYACVDKGAIR